MLLNIEIRQEQKYGLEVWYVVVEGQAIASFMSEPYAKKKAAEILFRMAQESRKALMSR